MGRLTGCFLETDWLREGSQGVWRQGHDVRAWVGPSIPVTSADPSVLVVFGSVWFDPQRD